jgi:ankyrin repeat protein
MDSPAMSIHLAAKNGDHTEVERYLKSGLNIDEKVSDPDQSIYGWTALHFAAHAGQLQIATMLLAAGANPNAQEDKDDQTPLFFAIERKDLEMIRTLLQTKANVNLQRLDGDSVLIQAASEGYAEVVELLLKSGADLDLRDNLGWTAIVWAATKGFDQIVKLLIDHKISEQSIESDGDRTALLIAASVGNTDITRLLLKSNYDPSSDSYQMALQAAAINGHYEIVSILNHKQN